MKKYTTKDLVVFGLLIGMTIVMTIILPIPSIVTHGYINLGDMVVLFAALHLGKRAGAIVGGVGSALADIILGYTLYAPATLIIKGLEGVICAYLFEKNGKTNTVIPTVVAGASMAVGYFLYECVIYTPTAAAVSIPGNILQGVVGAVSASLIYAAFSKIRRFEDN